MNARTILTSAMLAWTATVAYFVFELTSEPDPSSTGVSFYRGLGAGLAEHVLNTFYGDLGARLGERGINGGILFLILVVWPAGLSLIWGAARGWATIRRWHRR